jgi:site-specific recombinase XerD
MLFPSQKGGAVSRMQFLRVFRKYALAVDVSADLAHPHILRHTLCSTKAAEHADVYARQQRAGHQNISSTMIHTHVSDERASESCRVALMTAFAERLHSAYSVTFSHFVSRKQST